MMEGSMSSEAQELAQESQRPGGRVTKWSVRTYGNRHYAHRGLAYGGDWISVEYLAELLSGEDEGRVKVTDVEHLLDLIEKGLADA